MERIDLEGLNGKVKALYGYSGFNSNGNTILLKLMNGSYALLGDKQDFLPKNIIHSEVFSYDFSDINYEERFYLECGLEMYLAYPPTESDYERMIKQDVNKLPRIKELENQYGCRNVEYEVISGYGLRGKVKVTVYDRVIYCLEPLNKSFDPCHIDNGLPLLKDTKLLSQAIGIKSWYTYALNNPHCFTLTPAGVLTAYQQKEENWFELFFMENIQAFSASNKNIILLTEDRRLYYGDTDDFLKKKSLEALNELTDEKQNDIFIN